MATTQQQFCVRWNSYQSNLQNAFPKLLTSEHFVDVTLACESEMVKCHKVVLSACSTYFEKLLVQNPCQHPIIFMKDMRFAEMQALVDFMYKGEVNVTQDELPSLLRSAEALQIRGLCGSDQLLSQHYLHNNQGSRTPTPQSQINGEKKDQTTTAPSTPSAPNTPAAVSTPAEPKTNQEQPTHTVTENGRVANDTQVAIKRELENDASLDCSSLGGDDPTEHLQQGMRSNSLTSTPRVPASQTLINSTLKDDPYDNDDSYYDTETDLMDTEYLEQDDYELNQPGTSSGLIKTEKSPDFAIANVSCQYSSDGSAGGGIPGARRIRRSEAELRRAAECITRGQTFQTVSDQFNIPISTIRFYMARKGILPRRKRGRACSTAGPSMSMMSQGSSGGFHSASGNTSPSGPPYHIVHYKLPVLGAKLK